MSEFGAVVSNPLIARALVVGALISLCAAMLGVVLVLKRFALIGHGLGEVGFAAVAIAMAAGVAPMAVAISSMVSNRARISLRSGVSGAKPRPSARPLR